MRDVLRHAFYEGYVCCSCKSCGVVCFGTSSTTLVSVSSDEVVVVVFFEKTR